MEDAFKEYMEHQVDMMNKSKAIIVKLEKANANFKESIYLTTQVLNEFEFDTNTLNDTVNNNETTIKLNLLLIENSDELDVTNLFTIALDFEFEIFDEIIQEFINNELNNSERGEFIKLILNILLLLLVSMILKVNLI